MPGAGLDVLRSKRVQSLSFSEVIIGQQEPCVHGALSHPYQELPAEVADQGWLQGRGDHKQLVSVYFMFIYLKGRAREEVGGRGRGREILHPLIHSSNAPTVRTGPGGRWEPRIQPGSPTCVAGTQILELLLLLPRVHFSKKLKSEANLALN